MRLRAPLALPLLCAIALAPAATAQDAQPGVAVIKVTVSQPGNGPARAVVVDRTTVDLCFNEDPQVCIDAGRDVEVEWDVYGLEKDQVLRVFVKQGGGRSEARGVNGSMFRSNYAANANGRLASGRPNNPDFGNGRSQRWRYRILVYSESDGRVVGSLDPTILVKRGP